MIGVSLLTGSSQADTLSTGAQIGTSRLYPGDGANPPEYWRVWARRTDGHLLSLRDGQGGSYPLWTDHGSPLGHAVSSQGVSATYWTSGGSHHERAYFLDGNTLIEVRAKDGAEEGSRSFGGPPNKVLTGRFAATRGYSANLARWIGLVFATAKDNGSSTYSQLWVAEVDGVVATWFPIGGANQFSNTDPIAASSSTDGLYARGFASTTSGSLVASRWNVDTATATTVSLSAPAGKQLCGTIAATEGPSGPAGQYRAYVFCTRRNGAESQVLFRFSTSPTGMGGTWQPWGAIQAGANVMNSGYALAASSSNSVSATTAHVFVLTAASRILVGNTVPGTGEMPANFTDLGDDGEFVTRAGGLAAVPFQSGQAWGFYLGPIVNAARVYRRLSGSSETEPSVWKNHGSGNGFESLASTGVTGQEPSTALWRGRGITSSLRASQAAGPQRVYARFSTDDAENWTAGTQLTAGTADANLTVFSPVSAFTDDGVAYTQMVGLDTADDTCGGVPSDGEIYAVTTTDGVVFNPPIRVVARNAYHPCDNHVSGVCAGDGPSCPACAGDICNHLDTCFTPADDCWCHVDYWYTPLHSAWLAIEQRPGAADVLHIAWYDNNPTVGGMARESIFYARATHPLAADPPAVVLAAGYPPNLQLPPGAPVVTVGVPGNVYVGTPNGICKVDPATWTSCLDVRNYDANSNRSEDQDIGIPGTSSSMAIGDTGAPFALVASRVDPNLVYYAFQRNEVPGDRDSPLDLYYQRIRYNPATARFDAPSPPLPLTDRQQDGVDQFQPSLTIMANAGTSVDSVFASWYDRRDPCLALPNRCYRGKRAVYSAVLGAFGFVEDLPIDILNSQSDPMVLPVGPCNGMRSVGAYHHVTADRYHSFHTVVGAQLGLPIEQASIARGWVSGGFWSWSN